MLLYIILHSLSFINYSIATPLQILAMHIYKKESHLPRCS